MASEGLLDLIGPGDGEVVQAVGAEGDGLGHGEDEPCLSKALGSLFLAGGALRSMGSGPLRSPLGGAAPLRRARYLTIRGRNLDPWGLSLYAHREGASCAWGGCTLDEHIIPAQGAFFLT